MFIKSTTRIHYYSLLIIFPSSQYMSISRGLGTVQGNPGHVNFLYSPNEPLVWKRLETLNLLYCICHLIFHLLFSGFSNTARPCLQREPLYFRRSVSPPLVQKTGRLFSSALQDGRRPLVIVGKTELAETRDSSLEASCVGSTLTMLDSLQMLLLVTFPFSLNVYAIPDTRVRID
jgi:hypothetical protein